MRKIIFYKTPGGKQPVAESLDQLIQSKNPKDHELGCDIASSIALLEKSSKKDLDTVLSKKLQGYPLWELKVNNIRVIYCTITDGTICLLHMFTKKSNETPKRHVETALKRYRNLLKNDSKNFLDDQRMGKK